MENHLQGDETFFLGFWFKNFPQTMVLDVLEALGELVPSDWQLFELRNFFSKMSPQRLFLKLFFSSFSLSQTLSNEL